MNDTSRASTSHDKSFQGGNRVREVPDSDSEHEEWVDATDKLDEDLVDGDTGLSDEDIRVSSFGRLVANRTSSFD
jgi:hypothetical protein